MSTESQAIPAEDSTDAQATHRRLRIGPGAIVIVLLLVLIAVIAYAVLSREDAGGSDLGLTTIAALRADPDRFDGNLVRLRGRPEDIRKLPYLDQYAVYTFRDETGSMLVLTQRGAPPDDGDAPLELRAVFHAKVTLDAAIEEIVKEKFGRLAGEVVKAILPGVPLNVVYLEHRSYDTGQ